MTRTPPWLLLLLALLVGCSGKPPVDHPMHQFLYKMQTMDESLEKIGDDGLDVLIAYDEKHDQRHAQAALESLEDDWRLINGDCRDTKAPPGGEELTKQMQTRLQLVRKQLDSANAYLRGVEPQQQLKDYESFARRLAADFQFPAEMRSLAKKANVELTDRKKIPKP